MNMRLRTKKLLWAGLIGAGVMLILMVGIGYFLFTKSQAREIELRKQFESDLSVLKETAALNEEGYALTADVERGQMITEGMLEKVTLPEAAKSMDTVELMAVSTNTYYAKTDLKSNTVLVESMLYEEEHVENDVREGEYSFIELPTKLKKNDYVDIRIQFPNGDDYIFLSKKLVKDTVGLTVWFDIDEGEQLTMSSAIVDAFVEEAKIYAMPYVDGPMQVGSQVTYPVKDNVLAVIQDSPNIVNRAKLNLEAQNRARLDNSLAETDDKERTKLRQKESQYESERKRADLERERTLNALNQFDKDTMEDELLNEPAQEGEDSNS